MPIHFLGEANIPDFLERKGMDEYADNCIYIVENLNFYPEEFSCLVAKPELIADKTGDEENPELSKPMSQEFGSRKASKAVLGSAALSDAKPDEDGEGHEEEI